jgi:predicted enzyme related to lactoylglutathione lyase
MQLKFIGLMVEDQGKALDFYTSTLGFKKVSDVPAGEYRWLTVSSPDGVEGVELVLEPAVFPPARTYQKALLEAGIPATAFMTKDVEADYGRLKSKGVKFTGEPVQVEGAKLAVFEDTCGNLIQLMQVLGGKS